MSRKRKSTTLQSNFLKIKTARKSTNGPSTFECSTCFELFDFQSQLIVHEMNHKVKVTCSVCSKQIFEENLVKHMNYHVQNESYYCNFCDERFTSKNFVLLHLRGEHFKSHLFYCHCGREYERERDYYKHLMTHSNVQPYGCDSCTKSFKEMKKLEFHVVGCHLGLKVFECEACGERFKSVNKMAEHYEAKHGGLENYECLECDEKFVTEKYTKVHLKTAHKVDVKGFRKISKSARKPHTKAKTPSNPKPTNTTQKPIPDNEDSSNSFDFHHENSSDRDKSPGKQEPEFFNFNDPLIKKEPEDSTITSYSPQQSFSCPNCTQPFQWQSELDQHKSNCTTFRCEFCQKLFSDQFTMEVHINMSHVNEKIHECGLCDFSTEKYYLFRNHKMTHEKTMKKFKCTKCATNFSSEKDLLEHDANLHYEGSDFGCRTCGMSFRTHKQLHRHMRTAHVSTIQDLVQTTIQFTADEVNLCTILENGTLRLLPRNHTAVPGKKSYCSVLCRKLTPVSATSSKFIIKEGWKKSGRFNRVTYVYCEHGKKMPITYKYSEHKMDEPLSFRFKISCLVCSGHQSSNLREQEQPVEIEMKETGTELGLCDAVHMMRTGIMKYLDEVELECRKELYPVDYFINRTAEYANGINTCVFETASKIRHLLSEADENQDGDDKDEDVEI